VELRIIRIHHIQITHALLLLFVMLLHQLIKLLLGLIPINTIQRSFRIILPIVENKPSRALRQALHKRHQQHRIHLHNDNRRAPRPLAPLSETDGDAQIDSERHDEAEDIGLKLLRQRFPTRFVGG
jgi:hypothetical protein